MLYIYRSICLSRFCLCYLKYLICKKNSSRRNFPIVYIQREVPIVFINPTMLYC
nr:MAG TPA: hypothetical protein [Caudoviricetes sp.]